MKKDLRDHLKTVHYDANYGNFQAGLYAEIRREAFGEDIGQSSWLTAEEQDRFLNMLALSPGKKLLDVACGSGGPALRIAEKTGCSLTGVDVHEDAIATARSLAVQRQLQHRAQFLVGDAAQDLPFTDGEFDAITCIDAINHLPERPRVLAEWARILKLGGRILFTDPITVTGALTAEEIAVRSSIGFFLFVPTDYDSRLIAECGLALKVREDVTDNMARLAERRRAARAARSDALREIEGQPTYERQQEFFAVPRDWLGKDVFRDICIWPRSHVCRRNVNHRTGSACGVGGEQNPRPSAKYAEGWDPGG